MEKKGTFWCTCTIPNNKKADIIHEDLVKAPASAGLDISSSREQAKCSHPSFICASQHAFVVQTDNGTKSNHSRKMRANGNEEKSPEVVVQSPMMSSSPSTSSVP